MLVWRWRSLGGNVECPRQAIHSLGAKRDRIMCTNDINMNLPLEITTKASIHQTTPLLTIQPYPHMPQLVSTATWFPFDAVRRKLDAYGVEGIFAFDTECQLDMIRAQII